MKVLIFEFITGGGFVQKELPDSLFNEGLLMLKALIKDFSFDSSIQITVMLDWRCKNIELPDNIKIVWVSNEQNVYDCLSELIELSDAVWPIAPETESELLHISLLVESKCKRLLNSSSQAVAVCSDKLLTAQILEKGGLAIVETTQLDVFSGKIIKPFVVKSKDGVGCLNNYYVTDQNEFDKINARIEEKDQFIVQPYIKGETLSLSCLFSNGKANLLCCNRQQVSINQGMFELKACEVNIATKNRENYQQLINNIAGAVDGLWGYIGIDIIQPEEAEPLILEINPRLTTSYVGINHAMGVNVADAVMNMISHQPDIQPTQNKQYTINL